MVFLNQKWGYPDTTNHWMVLHQSLSFALLLDGLGRLVAWQSMSTLFGAFGGVGADIHKRAAEGEAAADVFIILNASCVELSGALFHFFPNPIQILSKQSIKIPFLQPWN